MAFVISVKRSHSRFTVFLIRGTCLVSSITMLAEFDQQLANTLAEIRSQGLYKTERIITRPQDAKIRIAGGRRVLNHVREQLPWPGRSSGASIAAAKEALDTHGFGMARVRFICGTQDIHKELEAALTKFLGTEDTILYPSCFDANGGLFETLARRGGRRDLRRTQSRLDHRRHPALQSAALPLQTQRHGGSRSASCARPRKRASA